MDTEIETPTETEIVTETVRKTETGIATGIEVTEVTGTGIETTDTKPIPGERDICEHCLILPLVQCNVRLM